MNILFAFARRNKKLYYNLQLFFLVAIVSFGKVTPEQREEVQKFGLAIYSWDEFLLLVSYLINLRLDFVSSPFCNDCVVLRNSCSHRHST